MVNWAAPTTRLYRHPQAQKVEEIVSRKVWAFDCAGCGESHYLRGAHVQADGSLRCRDCDESGEWSDRLYWCPGCERTLPAADFAGRWGDEQQCADCRAGLRPEQACDHCGETFRPSRSDARFCSGRCRVAAHRKRATA